jgi:hypothetical protein
MPRHERPSDIQPEQPSEYHVSSFPRNTTAFRLPQKMARWPPSLSPVVHKKTHFLLPAVCSSCRPHPNNFIILRPKQRIFSKPLVLKQPTTSCLYPQCLLPSRQAEPQTVRTIILYPVSREMLTRSIAGGSGDASSSSTMPTTTTGGSSSNSGGSYDSNSGMNPAMTRWNVEAGPWTGYVPPR